MASAEPAVTTSHTEARESPAHEMFNLMALPILVGLALGGLVGYTDPMLATYAFLAYIVIDFVWIAIKPDTVPTLPAAILAHHAASFGLLCFPLAFPQQLGIYTCLNGAAEASTLILAVRRVVGLNRPVLKSLYWATFFPLRVVLYPLVLFWIYKEMKTYALWQAVVACGCQLALVAFQFGVVLFAVQDLLQEKAAAATPPASAPRGAIATAALSQPSGRVPAPAVRRQAPAPRVLPMGRTLRTRAMGPAPRAVLPARVSQPLRQVAAASHGTSTRPLTAVW